ncbi:uncharacterized protein EV154DRAFT_566795 [Mucor mucedo]|uniref:uncharacterized protein n=1 Tax=Mucor mucedo TaxID=29922 RepID=UPI002220A1FB|nr:uncharacterized protein EV154DRAFT_566795 [Mucor mucedo]KAI7888072.1 hypothetical protein EV154DRAFT_566795 [Mucor mucedo]
MLDSQYANDVLGFVNPTPDGNCGFRAVSAAVFGHEEAWIQVKKMMLATFLNVLALIVPYFVQCCSAAASRASSSAASLAAPPAPLPVALPAAPPAASFVAASPVASPAATLGASPVASPVAPGTAPPAATPAPLSAAPFVAARPLTFSPVIGDRFRRFPGVIVHAITTTTKAIRLPFARVARGQLELNTFVREYIFLQRNMAASQVRNLLLALILFLINDGVLTVRQHALLHSPNQTRSELESIRLALKLGAFIAQIVEDAGLTPLLLVALFPPSKLQRARVAVFADYKMFLQV